MCHALGSEEEWVLIWTAGGLRARKMAGCRRISAPLNPQLRALAALAGAVNVGAPAGIPGLNPVDPSRARLLGESGCAR